MESTDSMKQDNLIMPADSAKFIAENAKHVAINSEGVSKLAEKVISNIEAGNLKDFSYGDDGLHPTPNVPNVIDRIFTCDTLNFCFWSPSNGPKWSVNGHTGYYGLTAALQRAILEGHNIADAKYLSTITKEQLEIILRPDDGKPCLRLIESRVRFLQEIGTILLEKYGGTFKNCIKKADKSAIKLMEIVVNNFPSYRDESTFNGKRVTFYKRAQILVSDIWSCFDGKDLGEFHDMDKITMFADYRVPQALVHFGVLEYNPDLYQRLKDDEILDYGSAEEIEIRGCSIHAVELVNDAIKQIIASSSDCSVKSNTINSAMIDYYLWLYRRKNEKELEAIPFHKTICCYY